MTSVAQAAVDRLRRHSPADFHATLRGSIVQLEVLSAAGREWLDENVESEGWQWLGNTLCIDYRLWAQLQDGIIEAGLSV